MNPDSPQSPREELELRLTALLLGELPDAEAAALRETLASDPELAQLHDRLQRTLGLVREATPLSAAAEQAKPEPLTLDSQRRDALLKLFKQPAAKIIKPAVPFWTQRRRELAQVAAMIVASLITFVTVTFLSLSRRERGNVTVQSDNYDPRLAAEAFQAKAESEKVAQTLRTGHRYDYSTLTKSDDSAARTGVSQVNPAEGAQSARILIGGELTNLQYDPAPPSFSGTNAITANISPIRERVGQELEQMLADGSAAKKPGIIAAREEKAIADLQDGERKQTARRSYSAIALPGQSADGGTAASSPTAGNISDNFASWQHSRSSGLDPSKDLAAGPMNLNDEARATLRHLNMTAGGVGRIVPPGEAGINLGGEFRNSGSISTVSGRLAGGMGGMGGGGAGSGAPKSQSALGVNGPAATSDFFVEDRPDAGAKHYANRGLGEIPVTKAKAATGWDEQKASLDQLKSLPALGDLAARGRADQNGAEEGGRLSVAKPAVSGGDRSFVGRAVSDLSQPTAPAEQSYFGRAEPALRENLAQADGIIAGQTLSRDARQLGRMKEAKPGLAEMNSDAPVTGRADLGVVALKVEPAPVVAFDTDTLQRGNGPQLGKPAAQRPASDFAEFARQMAPSDSAPQKPQIASPTRSYDGTAKQDGFNLNVINPTPQSPPAPPAAEPQKAATGGDSVYSVNAVGYVNVDVPPSKFILITNTSPHASSANDVSGHGLNSPGKLTGLFQNQAVLIFPTSPSPTAPPPGIGNNNWGFSAPTPQPSDSLRVTSAGNDGATKQDGFNLDVIIPTPLDAATFKDDLNWRGTLERRRPEAGQVQLNFATPDAGGLSGSGEGKKAGATISGAINGQNNNSFGVNPVPQLPALLGQPNGRIKADLLSASPPAPDKKEREVATRSPIALPTAAEDELRQTARAEGLALSDPNGSRREVEELAKGLKVADSTPARTTAGDGVYAAGQSYTFTTDLLKEREKSAEGTKFPITVNDPNGREAERESLRRELTRGVSDPAALKRIEDKVNEIVDAPAGKKQRASVISPSGSEAAEIGKILDGLNQSREDAKANRLTEADQKLEALGDIPGIGLAFRKTEDKSARLAREEKSPSPEGKPAASTGTLVDEAARSAGEKKPETDEKKVFTRIFNVDPAKFIKGLEEVSGTSINDLTVDGGGGGGARNTNSIGDVFAIPRVAVSSSNAFTSGQAGGGQGGQGGGVAYVTRATPTILANDLTRLYFQAAGVNLGGGGTSGITAAGFGNRAGQGGAGGVPANPGTNGTTFAQVFFNDRNGTLMFRGTQQDLEIVEAAIEALGDTKAEPPPPPPPPATPPPTAPIPQPEISATENAFSTFSLNVSDVSFKLAAASLEKGVMPDVTTVRTEEFINALDYHDPEPTGGARLAFAWERARDPFAHDRDFLRFSVKTAASGRQAGRPLNLVLLLDNSGSMERADRVLIRQECLRVLAGQLQAGDRISVIAFARTARLWIDGLAGEQAAELPRRVGDLTPEGGTNLEDAMNLAYRTAARHFLPNGMNRVVLLTDGAANLGDVDPASLKKKVEAQRKQGVALDCFGIGWDGYNDDLLEALSRNGDGRYGFVNSPAAASTEFAGQLAGALKVAASDVKVQVEWNPRRVTVWRQIGYAKHQLKKEEFRDNKVDAAEIAAQEAGNALYTVQVNPAGEGPLGVVRVRYKLPGTSDYHEHEWAVPYEGASRPLEQTSEAMRLAASASAFSEWLVSSPFAGEVTPDRLLGYLNGIPERYAADPRPKQLETMIRQARSLVGK